MEQAVLRCRTGLALAAVVIVALVLSGCRAHRVENESKLSVFVQQPSEAPVAYRLQAGDELEIRFHGLSDENVLLPIRPDGYISLPMANELRAAGRTPGELRADIEAAYASELRNPSIAVIVKSFSSYKVHVGGEVAAPGVFELGGGRNVLQAIFEAGGFLPTASQKDVVVMRSAGPGGVKLVQVDLASALDGSDPRQNVALQPYDLVYVPPAPIVGLNRWVDYYVRRNLPFDFNVTWRLD